MPIRVGNDLWNSESGEMEEFHSDALKDDLPEEETEQAEIIIPCDDY